MFSEGTQNRHLVLSDRPSSDLGKPLHSSEHQFPVIVKMEIISTSQHHQEAFISVINYLHAPFKMKLHAWMLFIHSYKRFLTINDQTGILLKTNRAEFLPWVFVGVTTQNLVGSIHSLINHNFLQGRECLRCLYDSHSLFQSIGT